ncbi:DUF488 domain-containing protein [Enterocloster aldenensis]|uniref:DUF488 domain-containing protein n=1 Tax=Enterocloster aldenensis TaxID=358742 RepID=UPI000E419262|nr:DUF488 domain-containing protein [Enterocloster aldenensis]
MKIFTMGFTQKSAEQFFGLVSSNEIELLIDVRLNNQSQLAGFTKGRDLEFFLNKICNCKYEHNIIFAPTKEILNDYKKQQITWEEYVVQYNLLIEKRNVEKVFVKKYTEFNKILLLCSEATAENCHRRLLAERLKNCVANVDIVHL